MKSDLVSIIVPVYNVEKYLDECVISLINQTYKNIEIILVDDGSPDNCPKICDEWAKKDKRINVIHKKNGGLMSAWMMGVKNAKADFICFVDSDDYVKNNFVAALYSGLITNEADICICNYINKHCDKEIKNNDITKNNTIKIGKELENGALILKDIVPCRWNKIFKKQTILDAFKFLDDKISMGEDINLTFFALGQSKKIVLIKDHLYYYRVLNNSMSHADKDYWPHYKLLIPKLLEIEETFNFGVKDFILLYYAKIWIAKCLKYFFKKNDKKSIRDMLNSEVVKKVIKEMDKKSFNRKILCWAIKHKCIPLIKLAIKKMKV